MTKYKFERLAVYSHRTKENALFIAQQQADYSSSDFEPVRYEAAYEHADRYLEQYPEPFFIVPQDVLRCFILGA